MAKVGSKVVTTVGYDCERLLCDLQSVPCEHLSKPSCYHRQNKGRGTTQALSSPTSYACVNVKQQVSILRFLFSSHFQIRTVFQIWTRVWIKKPTQPSKRPTDATVWSVCDCALMHSCGAHDYQICVVFEKFKLNSGGGRKKNPQNAVLVKHS